MKKQIRVCMMVNNPVTHDQRVKREAFALTKAGYKLKIVGTKKNGFNKYENWNGIVIERVEPFMKALVSKFVKRKYEKVGGKATQNAESKRNSNGNSLMNFVRFLIGQFRMGFSFTKACLQFNPDVIHSHDLDVMPFAYLASTLANAKLVYDSHELWLEWRKNTVPISVLRYWSFFEKKAIKRMSFMITVSRPMRDYFLKKYNLKGEKVIVVRNCPFPKKCSTDRTVWIKYSIPIDKPIVIHQGLIKRGRGISELIEAAKLLPDVTFVLIGPVAPYYSHLLENLPSNTYWLNFVPYNMLRNLTCNADIGIVLTQPVDKSYELTLSNKIFDYMSAGLPIVASNVPSHILLERETKSLLLVNPYSPKDIADKIKLILSNPKLKEKMANFSRLWFMRKYNAEKELEKLVNKYSVTLLNL